MADEPSHSNWLQERRPDLKAIRLWCSPAGSPPILLTQWDYARLVDQFPAWRAVARPAAVAEVPALGEDDFPRTYGVPDVAMLDVVHGGRGGPPSPGCGDRHSALRRLGGLAAPTCAAAPAGPARDSGAVGVAREVGWCRY